MTSNTALSSALPRMMAVDPQLEVRLHPIVILNITRHVTRILQSHSPHNEHNSISNLNSSFFIFGVLLGRTLRDGGTEITTSYEAVECDNNNNENNNNNNNNNNTGRIDWAAIRDKRQRLLEVLPEMRVVGWYTVGNSCEALTHIGRHHHLSLCETFDEVSSSEILFALLLDWAPAKELATLPVYIFETIILHDNYSFQQQQKGRDGLNKIQQIGSDDNHKSTNNNNNNNNNKIIAPIIGMSRLAVQFSKIKFHLESDEISQVGIDVAMNSVGRMNHLSNSSNNNNNKAMIVTPQLHRIEQSLRLLKQRIILVIEYLRAVESGQIAQANPEVLRRVAKVCAMLPVASYNNNNNNRNNNNNNNFSCNENRRLVEVSTAVNEEGVQSLAVSLLALQTKCTQALRELIRTQKENIK